MQLPGGYDHRYYGYNIYDMRALILVRYEQLCTKCCELNWSSVYI